MNRSAFHRALMVAIPLLGLSACDREAGTSDEHETWIAARLFQQDGAPAAGARVRVFAVGDTARLPQAQAFVESDGTVRLPVLPRGQYTLVATDGAGNAVLIDSLLSTGAGSPPVDTLSRMGVLQGRIEVEPQHSPRIAWVQVLGMGLAANVDTLGRFRLEVPAGRVTLAALTREPQYTPTFRTVRTVSDSTVDMGAVRLEYTGIPIVEGLSVAYDSLNGVATLRWNRATTPGLLGYQVQWGGYQFFDIDNLSDTVFRDTLYRPETFDDQRKTREYAVVAVDSARKPGVAWRRVSLDVPSPWNVPRLGFRIDTTFRIELPENACDVIDTAAGHLVCIRERSATSSDLAYLHASDTAEVRVSRDGGAWTLLPIPAGSLRTVVWNDRIWVLRGIESGSRDSVPHPGYPSLMWTSPLYDGVLVETWTVGGELESVDTIQDYKSAWMYRLVVVSDTLLLSRDSVFLGGTANLPGSIYLPYSVGLRRLPTPLAKWSEEIPGKGIDLSELSVLDKSMGFFRYEVGKADWNGAEWSRLVGVSNGSGLYLQRSGETIPWRVGDGLFNRKHRGNGDTVPPFLIWKNCVLVHTSGANKIHGICPLD